MKADGLQRPSRRAGLGWNMGCSSILRGSRVEYVWTDAGQEVWSARDKVISLDSQKPMDITVWKSCCNLNSTCSRGLLPFPSLPGYFYPSGKQHLCSPSHQASNLCDPARSYYSRSFLPAPSVSQLQHSAVLPWCIG